MLGRKQKRRLIRIAALSFLALLIIGAVASANYHHLQRQAARIPASLRNELTFSPFVITLDNKNYKTTSFKLSNVGNGVQLFSFVVHFGNETVTTSEYTQPPEFVDIPEYKERFLNNVIQQSDTVQTANGTIYIGKQTKQNNKQLGILLERGLVVLFNPEKDLTNAQWRALGEQFEIQKISN